MAVLKSVEEMQIAINLAKAHLRKAHGEMVKVMDAMKRLPDECPTVEHIDVGIILSQTSIVSDQILQANAQACDTHSDMAVFARGCNPPLEIHDDGGIVALGGGGR